MDEAERAVAMRLILLTLTVVAVILPDLESVRIGAAERRIATPLAFGLLSLVVFLSLPRLFRFPRHVVFSAPSLIFLCYLSWITLGVGWSANRSETVTHVAVLWVAFVAALALATESPKRTVTIFCVCGFAIVLVSWAALAAGLPFALSTVGFWRLRGVMLHEQRLTLVCAAVVLLVVTSFLRKERLFGATPNSVIAMLILACIATVIATKARGFTTFFVLTLILVLVQMRGGFRFFVLFGAVAAAIVLVSISDLLISAISRGETDANLTNRIPIWSATIDLIRYKLWQGYGFAVYRLGFIDLFRNWIPTHAHNMWLHAAFETGLIGATLLGAFVFAVVYRGLMFARRYGALPYSFPVIVFALLCGSTGIVIGGKISPLYGLALLLALQEEHVRGLYRAAAAARSAPSAGAEGWAYLGAGARAAARVPERPS